MQPQLTADEWQALRSQTVISNIEGRCSRRTAVNIEIMRTFVRVRALATTHVDLAQRLAELEDTT